MRFSHDNIEGTTYGHIYRNQSKTDKRQRIPNLGPLWSVAEGENKAHENKTDIKIVKDNIEDVDAFKIE